MEIRISATDLARRTSEILARVRHRGDVVVVERHGRPVARILPPDAEPGATLADVVAALRRSGPPDPAFARDVEEVGAADRPPEDPWAS